MQYRIRFEGGAQEITFEAIKNFCTGKDVADIIKMNFKGQFHIYDENNIVVHEKDSIRNNSIFTVRRVQNIVVKKKRYWYR